jgi:hypothetical protein
MTSKPLREKWIIIAIKVFFIGLILQFFVHTFLTYGVGQEGRIWSIVRARKEIWILLAGLVI